ncbi:hypothetical protein LTR10_016178 [Elasticomyces elasticus]|uniref:SnoaL-like domain-containing protein n=1 Tax=Exophiala sideris TaxID=1016849 RepID=A0ABR0JEG7_9EURO|nr:hypothetical protein LTR10_016178 [Elasticomyces elasticus]KAK5027624.1 hypothetical protein LTR13_009557 [Exophiala sideris]KAK5032813.1 hypothetical protein LTS07_004223 [Exophiala sideris]KAK5062337.1 hypothetical protein LTR69_004695 [Exophiala sideris]KAK5177495.1 hypothetical protein LTR44_009905 [Eurotiomycetes sp. CCFEE 6388]
MPNAGGLTDREAAIDAIIRFVCSLDEGDDELCASAFTEDIYVDLTPFQKVGMKYDPVVGRQAVVERMMNAVGKPLDTTHCATNVRCTVTGGTADLTCCVMAQHFRGGQGPSPEFQDYYFFGNQYKASLVREGDLWRVNRLMITPAWVQGNPDVMKV